MLEKVGLLGVPLGRPHQFVARVSSVVGSISGNHVARCDEVLRQRACVSTQKVCSRFIQTCIVEADVSDHRPWPLNTTGVIVHLAGVTYPRGLLLGMPIADDICNSTHNV